MTNKERSVYLRECARRAGLCDEWYSSWSDDSGLYALVDKFVRGQDFCVEHDFPKITDILSLFTRAELRDVGVYVDEEDVFVESPSNPVVLGDTMMRIEYSGSDVGDVYVRHNSDVTVMVSDMSVVSVNVYDRAKVHIVGGSVNPVRVYRYGGDVTFEGNVVKRERSLK